MNDTLAWQFDYKKCRVDITCAALETLLVMAVNAQPNETGGTLVGYYSEDGLSACIDIVLEAQAVKKRNACSFIRPSDEVDTQLTETYKSTNGSRYYLGEWHTHPKSEPLPSEIDLTSIVELAKSQDVATNNPILIIVGGELNKDPFLMCYIAEPNGNVFVGIPDNRMRN